MQTKENVYEMVGSAEQGMNEEATAVKDTLIEQQVGSAALGKFKDVDALVRAYKSLQAEFTRRSQRLKRLELEAEKRKAGADVPCFGERNGPETTAMRPDLPMEGSIETEGERLLNMQDAATESVANEAVNTGVQAETVEADAGANAETVDDANEEYATFEKRPNGTIDGQTQERSVEAAEGVELQENADTAEALYLRAAANESVRLRIVGDYLSSIQKGGAPLMTGATGAQPIPLKRVESISQAGQRALVWLREKGRQK